MVTVTENVIDAQAGNAVQGLREQQDEQRENAVDVVYRGVGGGTAD